MLYSSLNLKLTGRPCCTKINNPDRGDVMEYMIGQRVIYQGVICIICRPENDCNPGAPWIDNPKVGFKHWVDEDNIKPLPNGQL